MNEKEIFAILQDLIAEKLGCKVEAVRPKSNLSLDLGADSLDRVNIIIEVEQKFGIQITDDEADKLETVQDFVELIEKKQSA